MTEQHDFIGGAGKRLKGGYYGDPGRGPKGETCGSCGHCYGRRYHLRNYYKCGLMRETRGPGTDVRLKTPACQHWRADDE